MVKCGRSLSGLSMFKLNPEPMTQLLRVLSLTGWL